MFNVNVVLLVLAFVCVQSIYCKSLPSYLKSCKRKDPALNKCVKEMLETLIKRSPKGLPELKIPQMEPFVIPKVTVDQGSSEAVNLKATFNDLTTTGLTKAQVTDVKVVLEPEPSFDFAFHIPALRMESNYIIDGKVLVVPIKGSGRSDVNLTDVTGRVKLGAKFVEKNGKKHIQLTKRDMELGTKNAHFHFDNLFDGNKELGETTNTFINENWREIYKEVKPVVAETIANVARTYLKNVLDEYSYDDIFPEK